MEGVLVPIKDEVLKQTFEKFKSTFQTTRE
jgi:hypothetical protein